MAETPGHVPSGHLACGPGATFQNVARNQAIPENPPHNNRKWRGPTGPIKNLSRSAKRKATGLEFCQECSQNKSVFRRQAVMWK
ncbi:hypothetical protein Ddc_11521 [Ditylenchus destructor]|nr:hypothetical protein Ddc_11521 [Ditylenchus destructor]